MKSSCKNYQSKFKKNKTNKESNNSNKNKKKLTHY